MYSTNVPSANEHALSLMKVQQEAHKALELARARQTKVSRDRFTPALPLVPGQDAVLVHSVPYLKALGKKAKITLPWMGPFSVLEGPDDNNNYKVEFGPMMSSIHPCVARSQLKPVHFPKKSMYPSKRFPIPGPIEVEGEEV
jgi:hypothetical protein